MSCWVECQSAFGRQKNWLEGSWVTHPCYLGASYLNCGWAWLYECQAYPDLGSEACWEVGVDRYPTRYRAEVQHTWEEWWPHLCRDPWLAKDPGDCF